MKFWRDTSGAAAVEFALIAPIMAMVLLGIGAGGGTVLAYNKARQAVSSGAQYAMNVSDQADNVEAMVLAAWSPPPPDADVNVTQQCYCAGADHNCSTNCDDGDYPLRMTTIRATGTYEGLLGPVQLAATQKVRTR